MSKTRVLIADDHPLFRVGIKSFLSQHSEFEPAGEASDGAEAVEMAAEMQPDIVLMDIHLPKLDGIQATRLIHEQNPDIKILALTSLTDEENVLQILHAGARGFVLKEANVDELAMAISTLAQGHSYFSKEVSSILFSKLENPNGEEVKEKNGENPLTVREYEILEQISEELSNKQIADKLYISPRTVETHRRNLMKKLKVKNTAGLVRAYLNFTQRLKPARLH